MIVMFGNTTASSQLITPQQNLFPSKTWAHTIHVLSSSSSAKIHTHMTQQNASSHQPLALCNKIEIAMETLVEAPDPEVRIDFALNCKCRATVRLRSLCATAQVAFKVQTSSPHKFLVNPPSGLVPPLSVATFQIILKPQSHLPSSFPRSPADRFLVKTARFTSDSPESLNSWFSSLPRGTSTQDLKLKVAFVGPFLLRHAVGVGDFDAVRSLIKRQSSVVSDLSLSEVESLLRVASQLDDSASAAMVGLLVEAGLKVADGDDAESRGRSDKVSSVDSKWESKGWSELHVAAALDQTDEILRMVGVMEFGSLDWRDKEGRTPLHLAVSRGNIRCARVLIGSGADKDAKSIDGRTALHRATANGDRPMVEMLIEAGADPTITNDRGRSALDVARDKGLKEIVEVLDRGEEVLMAARKGEVESLESLLRKGASMNYSDQYGLTPLHAAAIKGHKEAVVLLVELFGSDLEREDNEGHVPLHLAVIGGSKETVEVLVRNGANVIAKNKNSTTPLHIARIMGYGLISQFLIENGASSSSSSCNFVPSPSHSSLASML